MRHDFLCMARVWHSFMPYGSCWPLALEARRGVATKVWYIYGVYMVTKMAKRTTNAKHKATFTLDEATTRALQEASAATGKSQSLVVREAVAQYGARPDKMSPAERLHKLKVYREIVKAVPARPHAEVEAELEEIRRVRREDRRNW